MFCLGGSRVDAGRIFRMGSPEEVAIRAAAAHACVLIAQRIMEGGANVVCTSPHPLLNTRGSPHTKQARSFPTGFGPSFLFWVLYLSSCLIYMSHWG